MGHKKEDAWYHVNRYADHCVVRYNFITSEKDVGAITLASELDGVTRYFGIISHCISLCRCSKRTERQMLDTLLLIRNEMLAEIGKMLVEKYGEEA